MRGYILTLLDITQQKKETVLMEDLKKKAEEQSFLKSRFLASVSHDLRSPLHAIIGGSDILKRQNLPDESKNILEYIRIAGNNLLEQVDTIPVSYTHRDVYNRQVMNFVSGSRKILREKRSRFVHFLMKILRNVLRFLPIWKSWMRNGFTPRKNSKSCITKIPMRHF